MVRFWLGGALFQAAGSCPHVVDSGEGKQTLMTVIRALILFVRTLLS